MTSTTLALPTSSNAADWSDDEKAMVEAAGLVHTDARSGTKTLAERPVVAAFLAHCARTGLDPIARQIYCIARKSRGQLRWQTQISIDGARLVAERTGQYEGQTPVEWTADGREWVEVWLDDEPPRAARVGVLRRGFRDPLYAVARWESYAVYDDVWQNGQKVEGERKLSSMWAKMPDLMLGKVAESLALRKAFPMDLSGLYTSEEMAQADTVAAAPVEPPAVQRPAQVASAPSAPERDWAADIAAASTVEALTAVYRDAQQAGAFGDVVTFAEVEQTVESALWEQKKLLEATPVELVESKPVKVRARDWVREARALGADQLRALIVEAAAGGASESVIEQMEDLYRSLPVEPPEGDESWAVTAEDDRWQGKPAVLDDEPEASEPVSDAEPF